MVEQDGTALRREAGVEDLGPHGLDLADEIPPAGAHARNGNGLPDDARLHPAAVTVAGLAHGAAALAPQQGLGRRSARGVEVIGRHAAGRKARAQPLFAHQQEAVGHPAAVQHHADALFQLRVALDPVDHHRLFFLFHCSRRIHARTLRAACGPKNAAKPTMQSR